MSQSDQFRQYAEEALLSASQSKSEPEIKALTDLANVWALAAFQSERAEAAHRPLGQAAIWRLDLFSFAQTACELAKNR